MGGGGGTVDIFATDDSACSESTNNPAIPDPTLRLAGTEPLPVSLTGVTDQ